MASRRSAERRLHGPENPWGIVPGEAAGALAIVPFTGRRASGVTALASVEALGVSREPAPTGSGGVCIGQGLTAAFNGALAGLQDREQVAAVYCDMNGEHERGDELGFTLSRLSARLRAPGEFQAPADRWGDVGAATGPLLAAAAVASWRRGYAPGPTALLWASSGADPTRGAALLRSAIEPQPR